MMSELPSLSSIKTVLHKHWHQVSAVRAWSVYVWLVLTLTLIGGFLRLYKLSNTVMFLGDQGRDAIVVSRIFTDADPVFIGPVTSVGNMYLGPLYYYFMLPFLWLSYPSPMGPVYAVAIMGTLLIPLMYLLGAQMIGKRAALFATFLLAISSSAVELSRFSWNPNLMPFFGFLWFYCLYRSARGQRWYWVGVSLCLAVLIQLHYITFLAVAVSGLVWLWRVVAEKRRGKLQQLVWPTVLSLLIVLLSQLPVFLFDTRHDWLNARQFLKLLQGKDAFANDRTGLERLTEIIFQSRDRFAQFMVDITFALGSQTANLFAYLAVALSVIFWSKDKRSTVQTAVQLLLLTLLLSLIGLSIYKNEVYLHYLGFLLPLVFLLYGYVLDRLIKLYRPLAVLVGFILVVFAWQNLEKTSFVGSGPKLAMLSATAEAIHARVKEGEQYTVLLISQSKDLYGMNYRYFLTTNHEKQPLDPELLAKAKTLFVLWEDKEVVEPLQLPLYELMVFNVATPSAVFDIPDGPTVLELRKD